MKAWRAAQAVKTLSSLGVTNVEVVRGPLTAGWPAGAPYDVILIEGAIEVMPDSFRSQLKDGGRLVCVRGRKPPAKAFAVPPDRGRTQRTADFRRHGPVAAGICREAGLRFLTGSHSVLAGVAAKAPNPLLFQGCGGKGMFGAQSSGYRYSVRGGPAIPARVRACGGVLGAA